VDQCGDEPLEIHASLPRVPVVVGRDRRVSALLAARELQATCLILDDGFQHRPLHRDFDLVLADAADPFGSGRLLPAGPLREPLRALRRAQAILLTRADRAHDLDASARRLRDLAPSAWIGTARHLPRKLIRLAGSSPAPRAGDSVLVAAAMADPRSVAQSAQALGLDVAELIAFPDHHRFSAGDLRRVLSRSGGRPIVTTGKDAPRWAELKVPDRSEPWWVLEVAFEPEAPREVLSRIEEAFEAGRGRQAGGGNPPGAGDKQRRAPGAGALPNQSAPGAETSGKGAILAG
jgi:tetraacyldisaccharide 4'-kinase